MAAFQNVNSNNLPGKDGAADASVAQNFQSDRDTEGERLRISLGLKASRTAEMFSNRRNSRLWLPWRRTAEHETTQGGQNCNPSSSSAAGKRLCQPLTVCAKPTPRSHLIRLSQKLCHENKSAVKRHRLHLREIRAAFCRTGTATALVTPKFVTIVFSREAGELKCTQET